MKKINAVLFLCAALCMLAGSCNKEGTVTDIEGNVYRTVMIGTREWMAENLKTATYQNGAPIPAIADNNTGEYLTAGAWIIYDNAVANEAAYGKLYNWYAVQDSQGLCPDGWQVPSDEDWNVLVEYLGGDKNAGCPMKEAGTGHWESPNTCATNTSGFTGLPGGYHDPSGFVNLGRHGAWWSTTENNDERAWFRSLNYNNAYIYRIFQSKTNCISVRCVKD